MPITRHHETGKPPTLHVRPDDATYGLLLDSKVIQCIDILPENEQGQILLGKRTREPQPDWWVFGGAMPIKVSPETGAHLNFKRETTVSIEPERFWFVGWYSLIWDTRAQEPSSNGCHMTTSLYSAVLSEDEIAGLAPDDEYSETMWVDPAKIAGNSDYHPALSNMISEFLLKRP